MPDHPTPTILIIDNDERLVEGLVTRLDKEGYECVTAKSGAQGLATFGDQRIDLVITDINMPAGDGVALAESIRQISDVPIIVLTGFRYAYRDRLRSVHGVTVINKPVRWANFRELVEAELILAGSTLPSDAA